MNNGRVGIRRLARLYSFRAIHVAFTRASHDTIPPLRHVHHHSLQQINFLSRTTQCCRAFSDDADSANVILQELMGRKKSVGGSMEQPADNDDNDDADFKRLAHELTRKYCTLPPIDTSDAANARVATIRLLATVLGHAKEEDILEAARALEQHVLLLDQDDSKENLPLLRSELIGRLRDKCTPAYETLFQTILGTNAQEGMRFLIAFRQDLLRLIRAQTNDEEIRRRQLKNLDAHLRQLLTTWFSPEALGALRVVFLPLVWSTVCSVFLLLLTLSCLNSL